MARLVVFAAAAFVLLAASVSLSSATLYTVGEGRGWAVPPKGTESYNHWARRYRFRLGDVLEFKYVNDSVVVVNYDGYRQCSTPNPVTRFTGGDTKLTLDRSGLNYFISGVREHCEGGQRMSLRVKYEGTRAGAPGSAPAPGPTSAMPRSRINAAPSPAVTAPVTPRSPSTSGPITSPGPSPGPAQANGASGRALTGFSTAAAVLVVCVAAVFIVV
ncbi:early nodulin-like protein 1 [Oryza brachyantha]|uniref:Phytocyanin domain-containing protein n=1 Tax=Oryza brachyantha TaxID=4533 RepID=J3LGM5_ORYBR|nr:early nodulin-like protein 1 [Oryza brachyantha]